MHLQAQLMQEYNENNHKLFNFRKAYWNKRQRERSENPVFQFIASCSVGSGSSGHMYSTK